MEESSRRKELTINRPVPIRALGIDENEPINLRRLDVEQLSAKNLEKFLTVTPKDDTVEEQVEEFKFE